MLNPSANRTARSQVMPNTRRHPHLERFDHYLFLGPRRAPSFALGVVREASHPPVLAHHYCLEGLGQNKTKTSEISNRTRLRTFGSCDPLIKSEMKPTADQHPCLQAPAFTGGGAFSMLFLRVFSKLNGVSDQFGGFFQTGVNMLRNAAEHGD